MSISKIRRGRRRKEACRRKDRLIQTRVGVELQQFLKKEAKKRRLSVSHLLRNILEETFGLVDGVIDDVDRIVSNSVGFAQNITHDAKRVARAALCRKPVPDANLNSTVESESDRPDDAMGADESDNAEQTPPQQLDPLAHIYAWNPVMLNKDAQCSMCAARIEKGCQGFAGLSDDPSQKRHWLCQSCIDKF